MVKKKTNSRILEKKPGRLKIGVRVSLFNIHPASERSQKVMKNTVTIKDIAQPCFNDFTAKASGTGPQKGHPGECDTHIGSNAWWDQSCSDGRIPESDLPPGNHPQNYHQEAMPLR